MTKFKDIIFKKNVAIHCPEEWMADELLRYADSKGYRWSSGNTYLKYNLWNTNKEETIYILSRGRYSRLWENKNYFDDKVLHYNDVVMKDDTSLNYELVIKGRKAEIGDELWYPFAGTTIYIDEIIISKNEFKIVFNSASSSSKYRFYNIESINDYLFWEKPIIYQLPDTDGNLSEVKVGQKVFITDINTNETREGVATYLDKRDNSIFISCDDVMFGGFYVFEDVEDPHYTVTTNKPHKDFSDCPHWEDNPKAKYWTIARYGDSRFHHNKPERYLTEWLYSDWEHAGYRADLLNEDGVIEDWEYSLVKRPEGK